MADTQFFHRLSKFFGFDRSGAPGSVLIKQMGSGLVKCRTIALGASDVAGGVFSFKNPEESAIIIHSVLFDAQTKSSAACTVDVGVAATNISNDLIFNGIDVGAAAAKFSADADLFAECVKDGYITATKASGAAAGLAGFAYVFYSQIVT